MDRTATAKHFPGMIQGGYPPEPPQSKGVNLRDIALEETQEAEESLLELILAGVFGDMY